jgi:crotonobetainyl-CoA:carnitine CoA-transferase CaiB-like acyl-CoA transferase
MPDERGPFLPLSGISVLAWEQAVSLPMATRLFADLGATVIRLEAHTRAARRPRHLGNDLAHNKLSLALDLRSEDGRAVARRLVRNVDVLCENFTPRVKRAFGLTYDELRSERADLIMLSLSGYGQTGAWSERPTYGPGIESAAGHARSAGYADAPPTRPGTIVYADTISGFYAALAILGALHRRRATGEGAYIDLSMYEANAFHLGLSVTRSSLSGQPETRRGNADPAALIQDVFASRDAERWLAVTVRPEQEQALSDLIRTPARDPSVPSPPAAHLPARDPSVPSPPSFQGKGAGGLGHALAVWVRVRTAEQAATELQRIGIAAAPVLDARDLLRNKQLRARGAFSLIEHEQPVNGYRAHPHTALPWRFAGRPRAALQEAPAVGQDSRTVLRRWAGLDDAAIDRLVATGVVGESSEADPPERPREDPAAIEKRLARRLIAGYDHDPGARLGLPRQGGAGDDRPSAG